MSDIRKLMEAIEDISESSEMIEVNDTFHFELNDEVLVETGVVALGPDAIVVEADQKTLNILSEHFILEDFEELNESDIINFQDIFKNRRQTASDGKPEITGPATVLKYKKPEDLYREFFKSEFYTPSVDPDDNETEWLRTAMQFLADKFKKSKAKINAQEAMKLAMAMQQEALLRDKEVKEEFNLIRKYAGLNESKYPHVSMRMGSDSDASSAGSFKMGESEDLEEANPDWNKMAGALGGKDPDAKAIKGVTNFDALYSQVVDEIKDAGVRFPDDPVYEIENALEEVSRIFGKVNVSNKDELVNQILRKMAADGNLYKLWDDVGDVDDLIPEAKYHGREVPLGKKMKGDVKKSKVYVRKPNGKIVKVNFGDKNMRIKKNSPAHRKSFRARHHCENPGPRWKARYWSCKSW